MLFFKCPVLFLVATLLSISITGCSSPNNAAEVPLSDKSFEELLALHEDRDANVDRKALAEALRPHLEKLPTEQLLALRVQTAWMKSNADFLYPSLVEQVATHNLIVHGRVTRVTFGRDNVIRDILEHEPTVTVTTVEVDVLEQYPSEPAQSQLSLQSFLWWENTGAFREGHEYFLALRKKGNDFEKVDVVDVHPIQEDGKVAQAGPQGARCSVDETWNLIRQEFHLLEDEGVLSPEDRAKHLANLKKGNLNECVTAFRFLSENETPLDVKLLMDAVEFQYRSFGNDYEAKGEYQDFVLAVLPILTAAKDDNVAKRMYDLLLLESGHGRKELLTEYRFAGPMFELIACAPSSARRERLEHLFTSVFKKSFHNVRLLASLPGDDIDALLHDMLENPVRYGGKTTEDLAAVWEALAERGDMSIRPTLEQVATAPDKVQLPLPQGQGPDVTAGLARRSLRILSRHMQDEEAFPLLLAQYEQDERETQYELWRRIESGSPLSDAFVSVVDVTSCASAIARMAPDPVWIPKLKTALESPSEDPKKRCSPADLIHALYTCGDREYALNAALEGLKQPPEDTNLQEFDSDVQVRWKLVEFLAEVGETRALPYVQSLASGEGLTPYLDIDKRLRTEDVARHQPSYINYFRQVAIMALAKLGGQDIIPSLVGIYESGDKPTRFSAGWALYALGDDRAADLARGYATEEQSRASFVVFTIPQSSRTDDILLQRLRNCLDFDSTSLVGIPSFRSRYEKDILSILVMRLECRDERIRWTANECLKQITGQDFGFDAKAPLFLRVPIVTQWRAYVDSYLKNKS